MPFVPDEIVTATKLNRATFITAAGQQGSRTFTNTGYLDLDALTGGTGTLAAAIVTVNSGTEAKVTVCGTLLNSTLDAFTYIGYRISGATTAAAADDRMARLRAASTTLQATVCFTEVRTGLTAGVNVFEMQAKVGSGTGQLFNPQLIVEGVVG